MFMATIKKAVKATKAKVVKKVAPPKKIEEEVTPVACSLCHGRGLQDARHLCTACSGSGVV